MFENKYIKQLQDVQAQIRNCKATMAELKPPSPTTFKISKEVRGWFEALFYQQDPMVEDLIDNYKLQNESLDYLHKLGEYFVNVADYQTSKRKYKIELEKLQIKERCLKDKLGIN